MTGKIHSFETFGAADGPGVRFIVFLHGCGFRCAYCHNPDTWARPAAFEMTPDEVLSKALRYRDYWGKDGGITLSGGEPMLQPEFAADLFEKAHGLGITTSSTRRQGHSTVAMYTSNGFSMPPTRFFSTSRRSTRNFTGR